MDVSIYEIHQKAVLHYTYFLVGKKELAEDLTHDTFVKAFKNPKQIEGLDGQRAWLFTIARNTVYDHFKRAKIIEFISFTKNYERASTDYEPEQWLIQDEENYQLYKALGQLPMDYRQAVVLRKIEGYSIKECAGILGWNEAKVKNTTERGVKKLQQLLGGDIDEA